MNNTQHISGTKNPNIKTVCFDYDGVIVDGSEHVYKRQGLHAFNQHEKHYQHIPHGIGICFSFFRSCVKNPNIDVHIVTARGQIASKRVVTSLKHHKVMIDKQNLHFMSGAKKHNKIKELGADLFIDDQEHHLTPVIGCTMLLARLAE